MQDSETVKAEIRERAHHKDKVKRHVKLVVRQRILRDTLNPLEMSEERFKELYRFDRATAQKLIVEASRHIETPQVPILIRVFAALHYFVNGTYQNEFSRALNRNQFENVCMVADGLEKLAQLWIKFPEPHEYEPIQATFEGKTTLPGVIGAMDCTQVQIRKPKDRKIAKKYLNSDGFYSVNVQLTCDFNLKIMEAVCENGSTKDHELWEKTQTNTILESRYKAEKKRDAWLLADSRYNLTPWVLTPFRPANNEKQRKFNAIHGKARNCSYRLIRVLKTNFKCLRGIEGTPEQALKIIHACTVLHNMMLDRGLIKKDAVNNEDIWYFDEHEDEEIVHDRFVCWHINEGSWNRERALKKMLDTPKIRIEMRM